MISEINYEKELLINNRQLKYKGIFIANELFSAINKAIEQLLMKEEALILN